MSQDSFNLWSISVQVVGLLVSVIVGATVYWYAKETKRLRIATDKQVTLLHTQQQVASAPFVIPSFLQWDGGGSLFTHAPIKAVKPRLIVGLVNAADSPAIDVHVVLRKSDCYYCSVTIQDVLKAGQSAPTEPIEMLGPLRPEDLRKVIEQDFGVVPDQLFGALMTDNADTVFALFRNLKAELFLVGRNLTMKADGSGVDWRITRLFP
jgi:hypothetical protein